MASLPVRDQEVRDTLERIEQLLSKILKQGAPVADQLADINANLDDLGTGLEGLRADIDAALTTAGVDEAARAEINAKIDDYQQKVAAMRESVGGGDVVDNTLPETPS